ncbi:hypothetical protein [Bacillus sp. FJAT-27245]|nr:hypothetical protein [Bacillus sp. FJAT-27245]
MIFDKNFLNRKSLSYVKKLRTTILMADHYAAKIVFESGLDLVMAWM